jgi:hypothetical protein
MRFVDRSVFRYLLVGFVSLPFQLSVDAGQGYDDALPRYIPQSNGYNGVRYAGSDFSGDAYGRPYQAFNQWQGAGPDAVTSRLTPQVVPPMGYRFRSRPDTPTIADTQPRFRPQPMNGRPPYSSWRKGDGGAYEGISAPAPVFRPLGEKDLRAKQYLQQSQSSQGNFQPPAAATFGGFRNQGDFRGTAGYRPVWDR